MLRSTKPITLTIIKQICLIKTTLNPKGLQDNLLQKLRPVRSSLLQHDHVRMTTVHQRDKYIWLLTLQAKITHEFPGVPSLATQQINPLSQPLYLVLVHKKIVSGPCS
jgi:hypothetical protein